MNAPLVTEQNNRGLELAANVRKFVLESFPLARKRQIGNSDALIESGIVDSQGVLEVVGFIEHEYSIHVSDDDLVLDNFRSIDRIAAFIQSKTSHPA